MTLQELERRNPEWAPWLRAVAVALGAIDDPGWREAVPPSPAQRSPDAPLLAGARLSPDPSAVLRLLRALAGSAAGCDALAVLGNALEGDEQGAAALVAVPVLHACGRRWAGAIPQDWRHGYCPVCGSWPAHAEVCGVDRTRSLRCGGCGSAWQVHGLLCPYCGVRDHQELGALVVEQGGPAAVIDVCKRCRGYLKAFTRLRPAAPAEVMLDDLASVELDLAALTRDYRRPPGRGHRLGVTMVEKGVAQQA